MVMTLKIEVLWTDAVVLALVVAVLGYARYALRQSQARAQWRKVFGHSSAMASAVVLLFFLGVATLDSLHFRRALPSSAPQAVQAYSPDTESVLDVMLQRQKHAREESYSAPLATRAWGRVSTQVQGQVQRVQPRLTHAGRHLVDDGQEHASDLLRRVAAGTLLGAALTLLLSLGLWACLGPQVGWRQLLSGSTDLPWRAALLSVLVLSMVGGITWCLASQYHVLGTDKTGNDVLYQTLKSMRTAFVIGTLSTLATLPLAVGLGIMAGYFKGWVDEVIQYLYTVLSSIPSVLLIAACVLMMQVFIDTHPHLFETAAQRSDVRLFLLCVILGLTGWAGLCRLVRGETLKLRELDFVQAAAAFGVGPWRTMTRHILPNVMHLVIITTVLDFSALILVEAVLSYVGVGVDPSMHSFGGMINLARSEMSRDPVVWWSFAAAFVAMLALVLAANLFADSVRDAFDPRAAFYRAKRLKKSRITCGLPHA
jgi:peptide/nickel transport system permease protein